MKDFLVHDIETDNPTLFAHGDLMTGECGGQNKYLLLICEPGSFKEFPDTCVGVASFLEDENAQGLMREIRLQMSADGMAVNSVVIKEGKLIIED